MLRTNLISRGTAFPLPRRKPILPIPQMVSSQRLSYHSLIFRQSRMLHKRHSNRSIFNDIVGYFGQGSVRQAISRQRRKFSDKSIPSKHSTPHLHSSPATESATAAAAADTSLSGRLKKLSREYGWSAVGVYLLLSALDFPFCFLAVRWLGTERIGRWEHQIVEYLRRAVPFQWPEKWGGNSRLTKKRETAMEEEIEQELLVGYDHGVKAAQEQNSGESATIWTQLALAYAIHKSFIFIRIPLTAAILPKVVKTLRGWGWNIGKRTPKQTGSIAVKN